MITAWKFSQLDINRDRLLRNEELFSPHMKKTFGLIRRGRKCSKKLADSCDLDRNGGLSLEEWRKCLGRKTTSKGIVHRLFFIKGWIPSRIISDQAGFQQERTGKFVLLRQQRETNVMITKEI